ncbi:DUF2087 domain-containing protein [Pseudomonas veronii]|uniref:DUF2087 domain-containing protein n=1 Tax=Pseudomonas veronii TaxID=76761 RepID=A0A7Y0ZQH6_PSEVE|nr:DUF2087 domain-containing protein [Pseudomonas veronii]SEB89088.1 hypothetical protein SAMN04490199_3105 [Pseudomonas marginalis]KRP80291.1 hypothetical protein TU80_08055 [Pseudomonas veronii]MCT9824929.1 DUF2087 domain-containing protein [Pseudomonas veronii]MDF3241654.1 DUF2087 domain-containing protein [Pseudomonas veronii]NMX96049.1 DUF2087 domain-containing protein [Pseudomonas veronii]
MDKELPTDFEQFVETLTRLSSKNGLTLGRLSRQELAVMLLYISAALKPGERHSERDATAQLDQWKTQYAPMLRSDVVELRRTLIDGHYWMREPDGRGYELDSAISGHPLFIRLIEERLQLRIAEQLLTAARAREERKKAALQG